MRLLSQTLEVGDQIITGPVSSDKYDTISEIINEILKYLFPIALFIFFIYLLWAGLQLAANLGNPEALKKAQKRILNAVIGIALLAISYFAARFLTDLFFK